jgi:HK97 family phage major capsid protein
MDYEVLVKEITSKLESTVDVVMKQRLSEIVGPMVAEQVSGIVKELKAQRALFNQDITGLDDEQKKSFVETVKIAAGFRTKANEALLIEQDSRGGYLVSKEVARAILRIAASVGLVLSQATKWPMSTDELGVPSYTGAFLEGEYLGVDEQGTLSKITFSNANLIVKKWQLAFVVGNDLLADASVELADWLLALGGEALANKIDKEAFVGKGKPFVGILNHPDVTLYTLGSGQNTFASYKVVDDSSFVIANLEPSLYRGAAFYMHPTVWASLRIQKDGAGAYILPQAGAASNSVLSNNPTGGGVVPAGEILGFPVFTTNHLPSLSQSAASTKYIVFGNLKALAFGDKGELRVSQFESGNFNGEIGLKDQRALVYRNRHALTVALPKAFVVVKTAA